MNLKVLGCFGGDLYGKLPAFLINGSVLLDAGTIGNGLSLDEQLKIRSILLTHHHIDHMLGIPFFADAVFGQIPEPVKIYSLKSVIRNLKTHLLNDVIWPDFTNLPDSSDPTLLCESVEFFETHKCNEDLQFMAIPTCHSGPSAGYYIGDGSSGLIYTGDTGKCPGFWKGISEHVLSQPDMPVHGLIVECSFPNRLTEFARTTRHLSPQLLRQELESSDLKNIPVFIFHMKPQYINEIAAELQAIDHSLPDFKFELMHPDQEYDISRFTV